MTTPRTTLLVGVEPEAMDFSLPGIPKGATAETIKAGLAAIPAEFQARGERMAFCLVQPDATAEAQLEAMLKAQRYDCIVFGGGLRLPGAYLLLFERLLNTAHRCAPDAALAFNTTPRDTAEASARWAGRG